MNPYFFRLTVDNAHRATRAFCGGKGYHLGRIYPIINDYGIRIPPTVLVGTKLFREFVEQHNVRENIERINLQSQRSPSDRCRNTLIVGDKIYDEVKRDEEIRKFFQAQVFLESHMSNLTEAFDEICPRDNPVRLIARSSSVLEDRKKSQFKGIYDSILVQYSDDRERHFSNFLNAIKLVMASTFFTRATKYRSDRNISKEDEMGVILQPIVGNYHTNDDNEAGDFGPLVSGVTAYRPFSLVTTITRANRGLATSIVDRGKDLFRYRYSIETSNPSFWLNSAPNILYQLLSGEDGQITDKIMESIDMKRHKDACCQRNASYKGKTKRIFRDYITDHSDAMYNFYANYNLGFNLRDTFIPVVNMALKDIQDELGIGETEWSIVEEDGKRALYFLQWRPLLDQSRIMTKRIILPLVPQDRAIALSETVFGHRVTQGHLMIDPRMHSSSVVRSKYEDFIGEIVMSNVPLIVITNLSDLPFSGFAATKTIAGLIDLSGEEFQETSHNAEMIVGNNTPIISTKVFNRELIEALVDKESPLSKSNQPVEFVVDGHTERGLVYLPNQKSK